MQEVARYWATQYDVRWCERRLSGRASQPPGPHSMPLVRLNQKGALRDD
jgi:hypothetical protein